MTQMQIKYGAVIEHGRLGCSVANHIAIGAEDLASITGQVKSNAVIIMTSKH